MKLMLDLPITVNDMSDGDMARVIISLKKLVDDLNYILSHIGDENLDASIRKKLDNLQKDIEVLKEAKSDETT